MEGLCSTGQSPQWAVVPMEEEEVEEEEEEEIDDLASATDCQLTELTLPLSTTERYTRQGHCQFPSFTAI
jgi:hypothetical protein